MKRTIALIIAILCIFTACTNNPEEDNVTTTNTPNMTIMESFVEEETTELSLISQIEVKNFYNKRSRIGVEMQKLFAELYTLDGMTEDILNRFANVQEERNALRTSAQNLSGPAYSKLERMVNNDSYWIGPIITAEDVEMFNTPKATNISVYNQTIVIYEEFWYHIKWADNISIPDNNEDTFTKRVHTVIDKSKTGYAIIEREQGELPLLLIIYPD